MIRRLPICTNCTVSGSKGTSMGLLDWTSRPRLRRPPGRGRQSERTSQAKSLRSPGRSPIGLRGPSSPESTVWVPPPRRPRGRLASLARARTSQSSISSRSTKIDSSRTTARTRQTISPETSTYVDAFVGSPGVHFRVAHVLAHSLSTTTTPSHPLAQTPKPNDPSKPSRPTQGWVTPTGTIDNVHGTIEEPITLCGPKTAVFDGSNGNGGLAAAALRVVKSSNVRVVGFTLQNALKGLDVQMTNASTFANVSTRYTLQEGIRLRYNSTHNNVFGCNITFTGRLWAGIGEGVYVGTSTRNSIAAGRPEDRSDFNTISHNTFGEGIPAENIDLKEYTYGGTVANNTFNGTGIEGLNGAIAWVAIKGRAYTIANSTGAGTLRGGQVR